MKTKNNMFLKAVSVILCFVVLGLMAGCASIMHGTTQGVGFSSTPTGALITVDNKPCGNTPTIVELRRKDTHIVKIEMPGYLPFEATITRSVSGWVWGNIVFGGLIGLAVDAITGGLYKLAPEQVSAVLQKKGMSSLYRDDTIYVATVLQPDKSWQRIGELQKAY